MVTLPKKSKKVSSKSIATKQYVKSLLSKKMELKYETNINTGTSESFDYAGNFFNLSYPSQGVGDQARIGDSLEGVSLDINYYLEPDTTNEAKCVGRVLVFQWHGNTADTGTPAINDVLAGSSNINNILEHMKHDAVQGREFTVLYDKLHTLNAIRQVAVSKRISLKYAKKHHQFTAGASTGTNQIFCWFISNVDTAAMYKPQLRFNSKFQYRDA